MCEEENDLFFNHRLSYLFGEPRGGGRKDGERGPSPAFRVIHSAWTDTGFISARPDNTLSSVSG